MCERSGPVADTPLDVRVGRAAAGARAAGAAAPRTGMPAAMASAQQRAPQASVSAAAVASRAPNVVGPAQPFDYYCVLDFEATCQQGARINPQEIIEFPTVLIDARTMSVVDEFQSYVMPLRNAQLSSFCTDLTGIQQEWVDSAPAFADVLRRHTAWLQQHGLGAEGADGRSMAFVTCGDWDLKTMLPAQLALE